MPTAATPDLIARLADFATGTRYEDIPATALSHLKQVVADTLVAFAAGMQQPEMKALVERQLASGATGHATVIGAGRRAHPYDAAALNATAGCWLELDEGNLASNGHPGIQVIPAALAVAQQIGASGRDFLRAAAIGYELSGRIGSACDMRMIVHPHGTYGVVGAAVAVGLLERLPADRFGELISLAGSSPMAGNRMTMKDGATLRNWYAAHSAQMGQMAVRLVECGFTAPRDGITPTVDEVLYLNFRPREVLDGLGERWLLADGYIKLYPCGRPVHAAIDALRDALDQVPGGWPAPEAIARIVVRGFRFTVYLDRKDIRNAFATRFSTPFALASVVKHRSWGLEAFDERAAADPAIHALMQRVELVEVPAYTAVFPASSPCDVEVELADGRRYAAHCEHMRGEPQNPNDPAEWRAKFFGIGARVWGDALARRVYDDSLALDALADVRALAGGAAL